MNTDDIISLCSKIYDQERNKEGGIGAMLDRGSGAAIMVAMRRAVEAALAQPVAEPIAWEATTTGYIRFITHARYEKFSDAARRWYKPYRCSSCDDRSAPFQERLAEAHVPLFHDDPTDIPERRARFFEEANETCQALGMTREEAHALVDYTYDRPAGDPEKEIGAAALTLASICVTGGYDFAACAEADLAKLQRPETIARIRAKRATRHGRGPLPGFDPAPPASSLREGEK